MKQLIILIGIILLSITSYAQPGKVAVDNNAVCMPADVAKQVAQDLIIGDSAKALLSLTEEELSLTKDKLSYKDSIILNGKLKELSLIEQVKNERTQKEYSISMYENVKKEYADLSKKYKKHKAKKTFTDVLFILGLAGLTGVLILK